MLCLWCVQACLAQRGVWLRQSQDTVTRTCQASEALLQFELSREGVAWAAGAFQSEANECKDHDSCCDSRIRGKVFTSSAKAWMLCK